jgi:AcrR family transcriptional regulator
MGANKRAARRPYHHGDLRRVLLEQAALALAEEGPAALSLRELARRAGVSHAAPAHHFGDKAGLLTAIAVEGYTRLADALVEAGRAGGLLEAGVAYVGFAVAHRPHFEVMFRPELYRADDETLLEARQRADAELVRGVAALPGLTLAQAGLARLAAWSLVHGFATLWLQRALPGGLGDDPRALAREVGKILVGGRG